MNRQEWNARYPVRRMMSDGKWGFLLEFERLGMRECTYDTRREAAAARTRAFREFQKLQAEEAVRAVEVQLATLLGGGL